MKLCLQSRPFTILGIVRQHIPYASAIALYPKPKSAISLISATSCSLSFALGLPTPLIRALIRCPSPFCSFVSCLFLTCSGGCFRPRLTCAANTVSLGDIPASFFAALNFARDSGCHAPRPFSSPSLKLYPLGTRVLSFAIHFLSARDSASAVRHRCNIFVSKFSKPYFIIARWMYETKFPRFRWLFSLRESLCRVCPTYCIPFSLFVMQ